MNGATKTGPSASWTQDLPQTVGVGNYVDHGLPGSSTGGEGLPDGLTLVMLNTNANQDACQGASVQVTISVNGAGGSGGSGGTGGTGAGGTGGTGGSGAGTGGTGTGPASFVLTKSASPSSVVAGSSTPITYTLTATNNGGAPGGITVSDAAPAGTTLVSGSNSCSPVTPPALCSTWVTGSSTYWSISDLGAGGSASLSFQVTANSGDATGTISNTALWSGPGCMAQVTCPTNTTTTSVTAVTPLLITASATTSTYGTAPTVTPVYTPPIGTPLVTPPTCHSTVTASTAPGTYAGANTCSGASDPRYTITYASAPATVDAAPLTVTASSGSFTAGGTPPTITAGYSGFQNSDTPSSLTTPPACSTTATSSSSAGSYPSTCTGAADPNYTITYVPGSVTVQSGRSRLETTTTSQAPTTPPGGHDTAVGTTPSVSTTPGLAFTGALLSVEWLIGLAALLLGSRPRRHRAAIGPGGPHGRVTRPE